MRKKISRIVAGFLAALIVFNGSVGETVFAAKEGIIEEENIENSVAEETQPQEELEEQQEDEVQEDKVQEKVLQEDETEVINKSIDKEQTPDNQEVLQQEETQDKLTVNYFYLEKLSVFSGETQTVVLSLSNVTSEIHNVCLIYSDENGNEYQWNHKKANEGLFVFEKEFDESVEGILSFISVRFLENGQEREIVFADEDMKVKFGVNREYDGESSSENLEIESLTEEPEVTATVATIDEDGMTSERAEQNVADALAELGATTQSGKGRSAKAGNIVIVLDPGHDASHAGAQGNGVAEEVVTLKIAEYCKKELEQYAGVTVYMTRTTATCPFPETVGVSKGHIVDIKNRVRWAKTKGADAFVSFHLNAADSSSAGGAEVYYPGSWFASNDIVKQGADLANAIQKELVGLGLRDRKNKTADYAVNTESALCGFPGLIIEHAFLSNASEANAYLKTEAGMKKLGVADANGIVKCFGLVKGRWETDSAGNKYFYENNQKVYGGKKIGGYWYYFDTKTGIMKKGWRDKENQKFYYNEKGHLVSNMGLKIDGYWYYFTSTGAMLKGWRDKENQKFFYDEEGHLISDMGLEIDGAWYYFTSSGAMLKGWRNKESQKFYYDGKGQLVSDMGLKIDGYWYYFTSNGAMLKGWRDKENQKFYYNEEGHLVSNNGLKIDGYWYYFISSGAMLKGWRDKENQRFYYNEKGHLVSNTSLEIDGYWYYFTSSGAMLTGWHDNGGRKSYFDEEGRFARNIGLKIDGYWYYFIADGTILKGWRDKEGQRFYYDEEGHLISNAGLKVDGSWYYFTSSGAMLKGWRDKEGQRFYYDEEGHLISNIGLKIEGAWYYFTSSGAMLKGWRDKEGQRFYYNEKGHLASNIGLKVEGAWYYFTSSGAMLKGWRDKEGQRFYYNEEGCLLSNKGVKIDGYWYYFTSSGAMLKGWRDKDGQRFYYDEEGHLVTDTILTIGGKTYYFSKSGAVLDAQGASYYIEGQSAASVQKMIKYYEQGTTVSYPKALEKGGASTIEQFCRMYLEECKAEGIKAEVAFTQAMLETGFLRFGNDVSVEQFNFAGLGATGGGVPGASFVNVRTGIRAQVQHLKCYANKEPLNKACVDPRWSGSLRGKAPYVEWLSIQHNPYGTGWASDADYGVKLLSGIEKLLND